MHSRRTFLQRFLRTAGCVAATACLPLRPRTRIARAADRRVEFPQGVASADPQPDAVMLWVRAVWADGAARDVPVTVQVSTDPDFATVVLERSAMATADSDYTLRVLAQGLHPDTIYFYRFVADGAVSAPLGRTRTAPTAGADRAVNFAWVSCQNYEHGFYGAWRRMITDDEAAPAEQRIDFVLHVGDFIYEVADLNVPDREFRALFGDATYLRDRTGAERTVLPLPSGGRPGNYGGVAAATLEDFRHLYRRYLSDPDLQAARARWPFICTWDDHEFADNCWQGHTTLGAFQSGRLAANRAWFEYVPALLTGAPSLDGVPAQARDFRPAEVRDVPFGDVNEPEADREPNNLAAISSLVLFRSVAFGKHVELIIADTRSYRSDQCVPEWWAAKYFRERPLTKTPELIALLDAGREHDGGHAPAEIVNNGVTAPNPRREAPRGTMLGGAQKAWWKDTLAASRSSWKFWANSVSAMPLTFDFESIPFAGRPRVILNEDMWDGYPAERQELLAFLRDGHIRNVVSLSGDLHANLAGTLTVGTDAARRTAVCPEFVVAGISSTSMYRTLRYLASLIPKPGDATGLHSLLPLLGEDEEVFNNTIANGTLSSLVYQRSGSRWLARLVRNPEANPNYLYVDTNAVGYGLVRAEAEQCRVTLVTVEPPLRDLDGEPATVVRRAHFAVLGGDPRPLLVELDGQPPFPL